MGDFWAKRMLMHGLELELTSRGLNQEEHVHVHQAWQEFAAWTSFTPTAYICCIFPSTFLNCKTCQTRLLVYYTGGSYGAATPLSLHGTCI